MNVLSLFDGISCGQLAPNRAVVAYNNYYAAEIDKYATQVTQKNFPNTHQLGDVTKVKASNLPKIDLLIGGSPCQGFSFAGKQLNFDDPRSKLFFEFVRLLKELNPKYFLLENVVMKKESESIISELLGVKPIMINSSLVSAQNRKRLYWTNIPEIVAPIDKGITLNSVVDFALPLFKIGKWTSNTSFNGGKSKLQCLGKLTDKKARCVTTSRTHASNYYCNDDRTLYRTLTVNEVETLQTIPVGYTSCLSDTRAHHAIGNGWTVDVIAHIFKNML